MTTPSPASLSAPARAAARRGESPHAICNLIGYKSTSRSSERRPTCNLLGYIAAHARDAVHAALAPAFALFAALALAAAPAARAYIFGDPVTLADGKLALDFNVRVRVEQRDNTFDFNSLTDTANDDTFVLTRLRAGAKYTVSPTLSFYGQLQDVREYDSKRPNVPYVNAAEGDDRIDLRQLYVDIGDPRDSGWSGRVGRQMIAYGDQRLVGGFEWNNLARVFDGVKAVYNWADQRTTFDFLATSVVTPGETTTDRVKHYKLDRSDKDDLFLGVYVQNSGALKNTKLDAYLLYRGKTENLPNHVVPAPAFGNGNVRAFDVPEKIYTLGFRAQNISIAPLKGFDYIVEGAYQWGKARPGLPATTVRGFDWYDHRAYAFHAETGYTWERAPFVPRLGVEYDYASGDKNPSDTKSDGFLNLFHTNHLHYGFMDVFAWKNMQAKAVTFRARPFIYVDNSLKKGVLRLDYWWFDLARTTDFWYRANAIAIVRPAASRTGALPKDAGREFDATFTWSPSPPYEILLGYSHFDAGQYLAATGRADGASFSYAQLVLKF